MLASVMSENCETYWCKSVVFMVDPPQTLPYKSYSKMENLWNLGDYKILL